MLWWQNHAMINNLVFAKHQHMRVNSNQQMCVNSSNFNQYIKMDALWPMCIGSGASGNNSTITVNTLTPSDILRNHLIQQGLDWWRNVSARFFMPLKVMAILLVCVLLLYLTQISDIFVYTSQLHTWAVQHVKMPCIDKACPFASIITLWYVININVWKSLHTERPLKHTCSVSRQYSDSMCILVLLLRVGVFEINSTKHSCEGLA